MVEIKLTFATLDEAIAYLGKYRAAQSEAAAPAKTDKPEKEASAPKPVAKPQKAAADSGAEPVTASAGASASPSPAPAPAPVGQPKPEVPTYEKSGIGEKIGGYVGGKDSEGYAARRQNIVDLLAEFNVANGKLLKPEQFTPFLVKLNALAGPEAALG